MLNVKQVKETGMPIPGYENLYEVSSLGRVSNYRKIMKTYSINSGYQAVKLSKDGKKKSFLVHRLIATAFVPNPENKPVVNHIDGNKLNNAASNLEWVTTAENLQHARDTGLKTYNNPSTGLKLGTKSKYRNVTWDKSKNKWQAVVRHNGKNHFLKRFDSEEDAALHVNWILDQLQLHDRPRNIV
ncbi:HNH endonuclease [Alteromonas sp. RKMC-009]|uniref:HNH endonuclease n=1 Tax=Alteromonas sp. RKMC-009 TaxID=2267264 RepID=UPI001930ECCC|nr:HNH endonuclease [Alteromonas sp. RKMC-009]